MNLIGQNDESVRLAFYNVENLFDTINDPETNDDDFTPNGIKAWHYGRYLEKLDHIYKTLTALGGWDPPAVVGFCEVENRSVIYDLVTRTPFNKFNYEIIHQESPDKRGIDVGLIYYPRTFTPISFQAIPVHITEDGSSTTRDILHVKGLVFKTDTVHIFINHWPSRYGGQEKSEPRRMIAGKTLRHAVDSILNINPSANIIIMGDFNDEPGDHSLTEALGANSDTIPRSANDLFNCMYDYYKKGIGSEKHLSEWAVLDQIIVSYPLLNRQNRVNISGPTIFRPDFLIMPDEKYLGEKLFRTYQGPQYVGGYSDHLPVYVDLVKKRDY